MKMRPKPRHLSAVDTTALSKKSLNDFRESLAETNDCPKQCTSLSSTTKHHSKLGVLQQEMLGYPNLEKNLKNQWNKTAHAPCQDEQRKKCLLPYLIPIVIRVQTNARR